MKLRRFLGAATAAIVAVSSIAVTSFASTVPVGADDGGQFVCLVSNDSHVPVLSDASLAGQVTTVTLTLKTDKDKDFEAMVTGGTEWYGGGFGANSTSTGWMQTEWSIQDGVKALTMVPTENRYEYKITYSSDTPIFTDSEEYAFFWIQDWTSSTTFEVVSYELLNADGVDVRTLDSAADETTTAPEETEAPEETTAAPEEDEAEPTVEEDATSEEADEDEDVASEEADEDEDVASEEADEDEDDAAATVEDDTDAAATVEADDTTGETKDNPDTGVAGAAVAAGVVALAGAAIVVSRKRK